MGNRSLFRWYQVLICVTMLSKMDCYPDGVSVDASCSDLTPQHNSAPQTSTAPYDITFNPSTFTVGQIITVTLTSSSTGFKGFMIQARRADTSQNQELLGSFSGSSATRQACTGQALVHSSKTAKQTLSFTWTAPATSVGNITFRVTYVQSQLTFWANKASNVLMAADSSSSATTTADGATASITASPAATDSSSSTITTTSSFDDSSASKIYYTQCQLFSLIIALVYFL